MAARAAAAAAATRRIRNLRSLTQISTSINPPPYSLPISTPPYLKTLSSQSQSPLHYQSLLFKSFSSSPQPNSTNIAYLKSDQEFNNSLSKVEDDKLPAIFYFTAAWCGPCKMMSPIIEDLSLKYPHVNIYKIDVDQEELSLTLSKLGISSVPTFHLFNEGKKASEIVGADAGQLKKLMDEYYKKQQ